MFINGEPIGMHEEQIDGEGKITIWAKVTMILCCLSSCAHTDSNSSNRTFNGKLVSGETINICGNKIDSANFKISNSDYYKSLYALSIVDHGNSPLNERRSICITGELIYLGCETDENVICVDAGYDYGIKITDYKLN